jgi:hypothetical protein
MSDSARLCSAREVSDFFDTPPSLDFPKPPPRPPQPPWAGPPDGALGAAAALDPIVLVRTDDLGIGVTNLIVYPSSSGIEFALSILRRRGAEGDRWDHHDMLGGMRALHARTADGELPPEVLRFGVQFADGRKATSSPLPVPPRDGSMNRLSVDSASGQGKSPSTAPSLWRRGGGGTGNRYDQRYWLWPLPPPGPLAFVCEWPSEDVELTRVEVDAEPILQAADHAILLW